MENYAALLREAGRDTAAAEMEARAKTLRNNHTGENCWLRTPNAWHFHERELYFLAAGSLAR